MAISYSIQPSNVPPPDGFGAMLALAPPAGRGLSPIAPSMTVPAHPGMSPVFDPRAFLPPINPQDFEVQSLISVVDVIGYIRKRWLRGAVLGLMLAALTFYFLGMGAKIYEAESQMLLRIQDGSIVDIAGSSSRGPGELSSVQLLNNHRTEMLSRRYLSYLYDHLPAQQRDALLERELHSLGRKDELLQLVGLYKPGKPGEPRERFINLMIANVRVEPVKESHVLRVQIRDRDPQTAADLANHYIQEYTRYVADEEGQLSSDAATYLETKSEEQLKRLHESEKKLTEYRQQQGLPEDADSKDVSSDKLRQLNVAITEADLKLTKAKSDLNDLLAAQKAGRELTELRMFADNADVSFIRKQLDAKIAERAPLEATCGRRHPRMVALAKEIESLRGALDRAVASVVSMIQAEVDSQQRQIADYNRQLEAARGVALDVTGKNVQLNELREKVRIERDLYEKLESKRTQAVITGQFRNSGMLRVADVATAPEKPVKPSKPIAAVAAVLMFGLSLIGLPVAWGIFDDHVRKLFSPKAEKPAMQDPTQHTAYGYGYPVQQQVAPPAVSPFAIAAPPMMSLPQSPPSRPVYQQPFQQQPQPQAPPQAMPQAQMRPQTRPLPVMKPANGETTILARLPYVHGTTPEGMLSELLKPEPIGASSALHQLTSTLERQAMNRGSTAGVILITSAGTGEGKTLVSSALAAAFCHQGRRVFMMECNPSSPTLHQWFPRALQGCGAYANNLEALRYGHSNLFLLPGCDLPAHATNELLDGYRTWIERAKTEVDWIILDASPLLKSFANVAPLAPLATDVLIVNNPAKTTPAQLRAGVALLQPMMSSTALRGMVVNGS
ncbi:exopolysaccharide transport family protein [Prosthecobacter sp.]|uniref:exopolysaccharide transport family protein n=1 Tax=Prosthecobacter sp. TaxID=1965333 RepID=UPI003784C96B